MSSESTVQPPRALRLWPGVLAAAVLLLARLVLPVVWSDGTIYAVLGGLAGGVAVILWWLFLSRAPWLDRVGAVVLIVAGLAITWLVADVSITTGAMGGLLPMLVVPPLAVALVVWAVATRNLANGPRRVTMAATILAACTVWALVKTGGFDSSFDNDLMWRWAPTPEDQLVADPAATLPPSSGAAGPSTAAAAVAPAAEAGEVPAVAVSAAAASGVERRIEWPGFRGAARDGIVRGVRIETDWSAHPPAALWRRPIGPGWSSFAVHGSRLYTQEQRGEDEIVACYDATTGKPIWTHRDAVRFWESNGGAGPRATPTLDRGRVYAFGATGILNVLDEQTGALVWSKNVAADTNTDVPMWGFSSSPLVVGDLVVVAASGTLAAYEVVTGKTRWVGPHHGNGSYSSPQLLTIGGVEQVVLLSESGATGVAPSDGAVLWEYALSGAPVLQPSQTADGDLLIHEMSSANGAMSTRRVSVTRVDGRWTTAERWTSSGLKTMFNDLVIHKGHAYGFDGSILACIDLSDGSRRWKRGRYGSGQVVLLADQDVLLVIGEEGDLALVAATADEFKELARIPAIEGKTWNHPVLVGDLLFVRNGEEMAAFRLALAGR